uniref:IP10441p n=1 Tax=Drosophila melanogaster TaxID=7227 RepID=Q4V3G5_DROME|nr:IP10441p [Drosophila melanogaster]
MRLIWLQLLAAGVALYLANGCATAAKASTSRGVAQYKLPLPAPLPDHESVAVSGADQARRQQQQQKGASNQRRRTQVVRRRRPSSTTTTSSTSTTTTTTSTTTTTTTTTTPRPSLANGFNFFNRNFWSFGQQSLVAVRPPTKQAHPPKKFSPKDEVRPTKSGQDH